MHGKQIRKSEEALGQDEHKIEYRVKELSKTAKSRCKNVTCVSEESENKTVKNDETSISWEEVL